MSQALPQALDNLQPPDWVKDELLNRLMLVINHVLSSEPQAMARLARQKGQRIELAWRGATLQLTPSAAGLLERGEFDGFDLRLSVLDESIGTLLSTAMQGEKPRVRIEGDVQLAAEINWLIDNVRWDVQEDLSRLLGDAPAHVISQSARQLVGAVKQFVQSRRPPAAAAQQGA
ncbi:MAG: hypothetical protein RLZ63_1192 [Pseudomonadota bacterium]|jgi:ubiquinone biosynthesis protein UbiJ